MNDNMAPGSEIPFERFYGGDEAFGDWLEAQNMDEIIRTHLEHPRIFDDAQFIYFKKTGTELPMTFAECDEATKKELVKIVRSNEKMYDNLLTILAWEYDSYEND